MKFKVCVLAVAAVVVWGLKRYYADARVEELEWILQPTAQLVALFTGTAFVAVPGEGYVSHARLFVIEKSCAGVNFMIAAFALVVLARLHRVRSWGRAATSIAASLAISYVAAVVVNTVRITVALWLASRPAEPWVSAAQLHRIEGIVVYFVALLVLYELVQRLDRGGARLGEYAALPLGCYFGVTLVLPLANGAAQSGRAFVEHAVVVATVPLVLILVMCALSGSVRAARHAWSKRSTRVLRHRRGRSGSKPFDGLLASLSKFLQSRSPIALPLRSANARICPSGGSASIPNLNPGSDGTFVGVHNTKVSLE